MTPKSWAFRKKNKEQLYIGKGRLVNVFGENLRVAEGTRYGEAGQNRAVGAVRKTLRHYMFRQSGTQLYFTRNHLAQVSNFFLMAPKTKTRMHCSCCGSRGHRRDYCSCVDWESRGRHICIWAIPARRFFREWIRVVREIADVASQDSEWQLINHGSSG